MNHELHLIVGTGPLGTALAEHLTAQSKPVRMLNRSGKSPIPGVEARAIDVTAKGSERAFADASVVYNCTNAVYHRWLEDLSPVFRGIAAGAAAVKARYVMADNLYMYGPGSGPMVAGMPERAIGAKGQLRGELAREARDAGAAVLRGSDFFGPRVVGAYLGERTFRAILAGKPVDLVGDPDAPHSYTYIRDFAAGLAALGASAEGDGRVWHVPNPPAISTREFLTVAARLAGKPLRPRTAPRAVIYAMGWFSPMMRSLRETLYQFEAPFVVDSGEFEAKFGVKPTPLETAIRETLESQSP